MGYYMAGDYYSRGGIGSFLKGAVSTVARGAVGFVTGGPGGAISAVARNLVPQSRPSGIQIPPMQINPTAFLPGGQPLLQFGRRRRRMNYANGRALTRANRRVDGFVKLARKSLKHTGYRIVTKGSSKRKGTTIHEHGPGSVNVRG